MEIILGSKTLGKENTSSGSFQKYNDIPVVTLEKMGEKGTSRRFTFNLKAMKALGLSEGNRDEIVFGTIDAGESGGKEVVLVNKDNLDEGDYKSYKTSKNRVKTNSKERSKVISSNKITSEVEMFLHGTAGDEREYQLVPYGTIEEGVDSPLFKLELLTQNNKQETE